MEFQAIILFAIFLYGHGLQTESLEVVTPEPSHCRWPELCSPPIIPCAFVQIEATNCTSQPCLFTGGESFTVDTTFVPNKNTSSLHLRVSYVLELIEWSWELPTPGSFHAGTQYTISSGAIQFNRVLGTAGTVYVRVYDDIDKWTYVSRCFSARISNSSSEVSMDESNDDGPRAIFENI